MNKILELHSSASEAENINGRSPELQDSSRVMHFAVDAKPAQDRLFAAESSTGDCSSLSVSTSSAEINQSKTGQQVISESLAAEEPTENDATARLGRLWILAIALVTYLMIVLDISIVIAALPEIQHDFGLTSVQLSWIQNAYLLCFGGFLLVGARAGDAFGRKQIMFWGLAIFTLASFLIGAAPTAGIMIASRALQGIGAAILAPAILSLISTTFTEGPERTKALAYYSMVAGGGSSLGLVLGGILTENISWRVGFFLNVPVGIFLAVAVYQRLNQIQQSRTPVDVTGGVTSTLGMGLLVYGIVRCADAGLQDVGTIAALGTAVVLLTLFFVRESRSVSPMVPLWLFSSRQRLGAYLARMMFLGAIVSFFFFTSQYLQGVLGFTPLQAGLGFLPVTLTTLLGAILVPDLTRRIGNSRLLCGALVMAACGFLWLTQIDEVSLYWFDVALPMLAIGLGTGFALGPLTVAGVSGVENRFQGTASGVVNVAHQLGGTLGLAILVVVFTSVESPNVSAAGLLSLKISTVTFGAACMVIGAIVITGLLILPADSLRRRSAC